MENKNPEQEEPYSFNADDMTVTLNLEEGDVDCAIIVILTVNDNDYMVLLPLDENGENHTGDVWIYRYYENEEDIAGDPTLEYIEDMDEFETVSTAFDNFLDDSEYDEIFFEGRP